MFVTEAPCYLCAVRAINSGVSHVYYRTAPAPQPSTASSSCGERARRWCTIRAGGRAARAAPAGPRRRTPAGETDAPGSLPAFRRGAGAALDRRLAEGRVCRGVRRPRARARRRLQRWGGGHERSRFHPGRPQRLRARRGERPAQGGGDREGQSDVPDPHAMRHVRQARDQQRRGARALSATQSARRRHGHRAAPPSRKARRLVAGRAPRPRDDPVRVPYSSTSVRTLAEMPEVPSTGDRGRTRPRRDPSRAA